MKKIITIWMIGFVIAMATPFEWKAQGVDVKQIDGQLWQDMPINKKKMLSWHKADAYCSDLGVAYAGFMLRDFRLPTVKELKKLGDTKQFEKFEYKQYFNYWSSKKLIERKREYAYFVGYANDGIVDKYPIKFSQQVRCIYNGTLPVTESMPLEAIAQKIVKEIKQQEEQKSKIVKPSKPAYIPLMPLKKDEFEKSSDFAKRVAIEKARVQALNEKIDKDYDKELQTWHAASAKAKAMLDAQNSTAENKKRFAKALEEAMYLKYGAPLIQSASYDADKEEFTIVIVSTKAKKTQGFKSGNMLDKPVLAKQGLFSIESIENISADTTKVTLLFHKSLRRSMYLGHYKKVEHYIDYDKKIYSRTDHDNRWSPDYQDKISLYIPKLEETVYRAPFAYMLKNKVIKLNSIANPAYRVELKVPVNISYAKKFKSLLLSADFKPHVEFVWDEGKLEAVGITQIKDPEMLVIENAYNKAQDDEAALKAFIAKYPDTSYKNRATHALKSLQKQKRLKAEKREARIKAQEAQREQKEAKEREAYAAKKRVGDKVCMEGKMLLFMTVNISGYVEAVQNNKIQIRIADTKGQTPNYNGVTLRQDMMIWDGYDKWKRCE